MLEDMENDIALVKRAQQVLHINQHHLAVGVLGVTPGFISLVLTGRDKLPLRHRYILQAVLSSVPTRQPVLPPTHEGG